MRGHRGLFLFKVCINGEPMIAKIVTCGLGEAHIKDFKTPIILTALLDLHHTDEGSFLGIFGT